ncbi:response regulator [uncultured Tateyamaria sp.]|uniref:response regulator n=1 Tax=uncultured Tateyamaria sp. TaxID=455651 RepID=UPI0026296D86|nr:response regulator [uncultured Tateyamaria sp.]
MNPRSVLILEDEAIIAMDMEMMLEDNGFFVLGPCNSVEAARAAVASRRPDVAILDVNLGRGKTSFDFAEEIHALGVPFVFLSGYSESSFEAPETLKTALRLAKPVLESDLLSAVNQLAFRPG